MGCDIHPYVEIRVDGAWEHRPDEQFDDDRDYGLFGFLAGVRNYSESPVIVQPRGLPDDVSPEVATRHADSGFVPHHSTWLTVAEMLAYDYDQVFWDRRVTRDGDGAARAGEGEGQRLTLREFLCPRYFACLETLAGLADPADVRVVLWFDN